MASQRRDPPAWKADRYHHGNLRQALLDTAVELARAGGPDAVVLRDVQRRAGVSNSAAYRHYADRHGLLAAVTDHALGRLAAAMRAAVGAVPNRGPRARRALARFRATGAAYIDFALAEPGLFRTAFSPESSQATDPVAAGSGDAADDHPFRILTSCIDDLVDAGVLSANRRAGLDEAAWAAVHGLATLFLDGLLTTVDPDRMQLITDRLLDAIEDGIR
ncbi:MAG TPA: TetR/AcrR family transcriptional regulator [Mycobacterium sp.]|nr:TetR/AcrR family transcriptional regulator [Mycobacterium sp.]